MFLSLSFFYVTQTRYSTQLIKCLTYVGLAVQTTFDTLEILLFFYHNTEAQ